MFFDAKRVDILLRDDARLDHLERDLAPWDPGRSRNSQVTVGAFQIATQSTCAVVRPRACAMSYSVGTWTISLLSRHGSTRGGMPGWATSRPL